MEMRNWNPIFNYKMRYPELEEASNFQSQIGESKIGNGKLKCRASPMNSTWSPPKEHHWKWLEVVLMLARDNNQGERKELETSHRDSRRRKTNYAKTILTHLRIFVVNWLHIPSNGLANLPLDHLIGGLMGYRIAHENTPSINTQYKFFFLFILLTIL